MLPTIARQLGVSYSNREGWLSGLLGDPRPERRKREQHDHPVTKHLSRRHIFPDDLPVLLLRPSPDAMNQALRYVRGDWVFFLNCGDCFCDEQVLRQTTMMLNVISDISPVRGFFADFKIN